jgi:hypothetical protein
MRARWLSSATSTHLVPCMWRPQRLDVLAGAGARVHQPLGHQLLKGGPGTTCMCGNMPLANTVYDVRCNKATATELNEWCWKGVR